VKIFGKVATALAVSRETSEFAAQVQSSAIYRKLAQVAAPGGPAADGWIGGLMDWWRMGREQAKGYIIKVRSLQFMVRSRSRVHKVWMDKACPAVDKGAEF
jgi:hypothetical protein